MLELPVPEIIIFGAVAVFSLAAAIAGVLQLLDGGEKYKRFLPPLGGASIMFATASAFLYLLGRGKLKRKEIIQVLGRVPNIEKLEHMNLFGVRISFALLTIGLISGLWLASALGTGITGWLAEGKVVCIIAAWFLLAMLLLLNHTLLLNAEARAYMTIVISLLLLFAILGVTVLGVTQHNFSQ